MGGLIIGGWMDGWMGGRINGWIEEKADDGGYQDE